MQQIVIQLQRTVILEILQLFLQQRTQIAKSATKSEQTTFKFLQTLHDNYKTERNVAFYAEQSGLTPNHFMHVVKQVTGRTPMDWISTFTILEAKRLLSHKGARVKDAAAALHFPDQYTFTRYFKTYTGITPREFQTRKWGSRFSYFFFDNKRHFYLIKNSPRIKRIFMFIYIF